MQSEYQNDIIKIIEELQWTSGEVFLFRNKDYKFNDNYSKVERLTQVLYEECYAKKEMFQRPAIAAFDNIPLCPSFTEDLSLSNMSTEYFDFGWVVTNIFNNGFIEASKFGLTRTFRPSEYQKHNNKTPKINDRITVNFQKEDRLMQQGFYYAFSNVYFEYNPTILRIYFNILPKGAGLLIKTITESLNYYRIPFLFKTLLNPKDYSRRDCSVLYIQYKHFRIVKIMLDKFYDKLQECLAQDVPLFSLKYKSGIGIAESPIDGQSFGISRMRLFSKGLLNSMENKNDSFFNKLYQIQRSFLEAGIDWNKPFLNRNSKLDREDF